MPYRAWMLSAALGIATIVIIGAAAKYSFDSLSRYQQDHARDRIDATEHYTKAANQSPKSCRAIMSENSVVDWLTCVVEAVTADGGQKQSEYDLKAQQDMAEWAYGMLILTVWVALITFVGIVFVAWTLIVTRKMALDTRDIGEKQVRAYLKVIKINVRVFPDSHMRFSVHLKNSGNSPATKVVFSGNIMPEHIASFQIQAGDSQDTTITSSSEIEKSIRNGVFQFTLNIFWVDVFDTCSAFQVGGSIENVDLANTPTEGAVYSAILGWTVGLTAEGWADRPKTLSGYKRTGKQDSQKKHRDVIM